MGKYIKFIVFIFSTVIAISCSYRVVEDTYPETVEFNTHVKPLLENSCVSCHNGVSLPLDLSTKNVYETLVPKYITPFEPEESSFYQKLEEGHPFQGALSEYEMGLIKKWIEDGAVQ